MAWTDYSTTESASWASTVGSESNSSGVIAATEEPPAGGVAVGTSATAFINDLSSSYNVPGFDDGYAPATPDPIANNISDGGSGGGSTRPSTGFLYPRGQS